METTSSILAKLLQILGLKATITAKEINLSTFAISVVRQCTGLFEVITLIAAVIAYPTTIEKKIKGIEMGLPLIFIFNILRLILLAYLGVYYFPMFEIVHDYILQLTFFSFVIFIWFFWINSVVKRNVISI
jgi:archaeosortase B (VPXXXP-CTERM-specific)